MAFLDGDVLLLAALAAPLDVGEKQNGPPARTGRFFDRSLLLLDDLGRNGRLIECASGRADPYRLLVRATHWRGSRV